MSTGIAVPAADRLDFLSGSERDQLRPVLIQWDHILKESVLVEVHITKWHPSYRLREESLRQLGVYIDNPSARTALRQGVRLGQMDLIPRDVICRINRIEQQARALLKASSHRVLFGYVVHAQAYPAWKESHEILAAEFEKVADYIGDNLRVGDNLVGQMIEQYEILFADSYRRLKRLGTPFSRSEEAFVEEGIRFVEGHVPEASTVRAKYRFDTWLSETPMVDELAERAARAQQIQIQMELSEERMDRERQRIVEDMECDIQAQASARKERLEQSFVQAEALFYENIAQAVQDIRTAIGRNHRLSGRSALQLRNLVARVRSLNVFEDEQLAQDIDRVHQAFEKRLDSKGSDRADALDELRVTLEEVEVRTRRELQQLPKKRGVRALPVPEETAPIEAGLQRVVSVVPDEVDDMDDALVRLRRRRVAPAASI